MKNIQLILLPLTMSFLPACLNPSFGTEPGEKYYCADDNDCLSGYKCIDDLKGSKYCALTCQNNDDCDSTQYCQNNACYQLKELGNKCTNDNECLSGICHDEICSLHCQNNDDCDGDCNFCDTNSRFCEPREKFSGYGWCSGLRFQCDGAGQCECSTNFTGENCDQCKNTLMTGSNCDQCKNELMTGQNCDQCNDGYGKECKAYDSVTDQAGNTYKTVIINGQEWMAENYRRETGTYYYPDNNSSNVNTYGLLYNWATASAANFCPSGWRLPTKTDFDNLLTYVTNNKSSSSTSNFLALIAKSTAWTNYSNQGLDEFGFGALPAGDYASGRYNLFGDYGYFWSSTEDDGFLAYFLRLGDGNANVYDDRKAYGFSVRCLRDSN